MHVKTFLSKSIVKGSMVILPLLITAWVIWSAFLWLNGMGLDLLTFLHLDGFYFPGFGLLLMLVLLLVTGLAFEFNPVGWLYQYVEEGLLRFPVVKTLYGAVKDFAGMFDKEKEQSKQTVLLRVESLGQVIGFITSTKMPTPLQDALGRELVAVYVPMSYMIGGHTIFVPKEELTLVDWSFEDAMRFAITAGVSQTHAKHTGKHDNE
jgi:uncharacterized membrane protein